MPPPTLLTLFVHIAFNVSVAVGVGSYYVKVKDNGYGIARDGLVLLGERYTTSKVDHLALMDTGTENLDFHGEALCSISDVSLLEIVTKARGKPNGYRKIMKSCKCLFLGINDDRQDVGTTVVSYSNYYSWISLFAVIVRDIFYNQPVRRKHMESSPKKVLDSVKMSVLRIALVHVNISFKVVDVESGNELLHTEPSSSPLPILSSYFGIENSATFDKLNLSVGEMKLSGYLSDPREILSPKAIQYVYINSRFIHRGPIHKLLNQLAAKFDSLSSWQPSTSFHSEKRNKYDMCPTFILNLHCPRSYYDLITSDRTSVKFKDWGAILTFIENGVMRLWTENISPVTLEKDMPNNFGSGKKRHKEQNCLTPLDLDSPQQKKLCNDYDNMADFEGWLSSHEKLSRKVSELSRHQEEAGLLSETDYLSRSSGGSSVGYRVTTNKEIRNNLSPCSVYSQPHVAYTFGKEEDDISSTLGNMFPAFDAKFDDISIESGVSADCLKFSDAVHFDQEPSRKFLRSCSFEKGLLLERNSPAADENFELGSDDIKIEKIASGVSAGCLKFNDDVHFDQEPSRKFLRSCSFEKSLLHERNSPAVDESFELGSDDIRIEKRWIGCDDSMVEETNLAICGRDLHCKEAPLFQSSPMAEYDMHEILEFPVRDSVKSSLLFRNILPDSSKLGRKWTSSWQSFSSGWSPLTAEKFIGTKFLDDDEAIYHKSIKSCSEFGKDTIHGYSAERESDDVKHSNLNAKYRWQQQKCSIMNFSPDNKREFSEFQWGDFENMFSLKPFKRFNGTNWSPLPSYGEESPRKYSVPSLYDKSAVANKCGKPDIRNQETMLYRKKRSIRSHSAPPFHKGKKRYMDLTDSSTMLSTKSNFKNISATPPSMEPNDSSCGKLHLENRNLKCSRTSFGQYHPSPVERPVRDCSIAKRPGLKMTPEVITIQNGGPQKSGEFVNMESIECPDSMEVGDSVGSRGKWRKCFLPSTGGSGSDNKINHDIILDISSDIMHLAGDSLVPNSIDRTSLEDAKVLNQVDKKFIAVVAGNTLAIIDQHAADERIRLEDLRQKVLSGEMKTITYLDAEQELVDSDLGLDLQYSFPGYKFLLKVIIVFVHYRDRLAHPYYGVLACRHLDFLHTQQTVVKLLAVPCILDVNLTEIDLQEFLQQLADTDGSSTIPPSVHRVLNNKACRGAIMFGDALLPSECSLIVEELKRTSLCFQCAHGRPTTVPLVNMDLLRNKIAKLGSHESWHGLRQHKSSLERSAQRLSSALS
ncbi:hypothetical protein DH2020_038682 [Rehmannia glutinosa]|uniref:DNA mismatch repair protein MLH3 n=1 Tax=Rehmannia glutinosa TaxID=99300 RepID=A0ABR0UYK1_REHGL